MPRGLLLDDPPPYVVISPVRDEEQYIEGTIRSVAEQTAPPSAWIVVDDGSKDRTPEILDRYRAKHPWLQVVRRPDRGYRAAGSGVMEAFYSGYDALPASAGAWEYLVKLDGDLEFEPDYFRRCLTRFAENPRLGIGGGVIYNDIAGKLVLERHPDFHVRGATKIYRRACWEAIGGLLRVPGWDTLDEVKASMLGWETGSFREISLIQKRFTGDAAGQWSNWVKNGRASHICGYHPLYLLAKAAGRAFRTPYLVASLGIVYGYLKAWATRVPRAPDRDLLRFVRRQQLRRLFGLRSIWR